MVNITFIAPPAAGKGVLSQLVCEKYGLVHISIGDLLRNVEDEAIKKQLQQGALVNDDVVAKLLKNRLSKDDCKNGYVLDGFPRNMSQVSIYEDICQSNDKENFIIALDVPKEIGEKRIIGRRICPKCGEVYNSLIEESMPKMEGICDKCNHKLISRKDDNLDTYQDRYNTYLKETAPIIDHYETNNKVYHVDSSKSIDYAFKQIKDIIGGFYD